MRLMPRDRLLNALPWMIAALLVGGIVHIVSVLLTPLVAPRDAYSRVLEAARTVLATTETMPASGVIPLSSSGPGSQVLPFEDPAAAEGACVFDLTKGPLYLHAKVNSGDYVGLSFHSATGAIFHAMTDRSSNRGRIDIVVGDALQIEKLEADDPDDAPPRETRVASPSSRGFVLIRALAARPYDYQRARATVEAVTCEVAPQAP